MNLRFSRKVPVTGLAAPTTLRDGEDGPDRTFKLPNPNYFRP